MQKARRHRVPPAPTACKRTVSGSISLPCSGCFPPFPRGTGSLSVFGSIQPCGMVPAGSDRIPRAPPYSGGVSTPAPFPARACHPLRAAFPDGSSSRAGVLPTLLQPRPALKRAGLGSSLFARRYWGNRYFLSSPAGTKMFQFPAFAAAMTGGWAGRPARVAPFGHARIASCLRIPGLFRGLPRPSSPAEAKASSMRSDFSFSVNL